MTLGLGKRSSGPDRERGNAGALLGSLLAAASPRALTAYSCAFSERRHNPTPPRRANPNTRPRTRQHTHVGISTEEERRHKDNKTEKCDRKDFPLFRTQHSTSEESKDEFLQMFASFGPSDNIWIHAGSSVPTKI